MHRNLFCDVRTSGSILQSYHCICCAVWISTGADIWTLICVITEAAATRPDLATITKTRPTPICRQKTMPPCCLTRPG